MTLVLKSNTQVSNSALPRLTRDPLLRDDVNRGVKFAFDFAFPWCYSGASPVADQAIIRDISEHADGRFFVTAGQSPIIAGGGFDMSPLTGRSYIEIPSTFADAVAANGQEFLICLYLKMPVSDDWWLSASAKYFLTFNTAATGFQAAPDLLDIGLAQSSGVNQILAYRQKALASAQSRSTSPPPSSVYGGLTQLAVWRKAGVMQMRLRTAAETRDVAGVSDSDNTQSIAGLKGYLGCATPWSTSFNTNELAASNMRIFRGFFEALGLSGRDPVSVLDADWSRVLARNVFS